jgi:hypothetical protein
VRLTEDRVAQRRRLTLLRDWHSFLLNEIDLVIERWRRARAKESP